MGRVRNPSLPGQVGVTVGQVQTKDKGGVIQGPLVSRKFLEPLGEAVTLGTGRLDPEIRSLSTLGEQSQQAPGDSGRAVLLDGAQGPTIWLHGRALRPRPALEGRAALL